MVFDADPAGGLALRGIAREARSPAQSEPYGRIGIEKTWTTNFQSRKKGLPLTQGKKKSQIYFAVTVVEMFL